MQIRAIGGWIKGDAGYYIRFCDLIIPPIEEEEVVTEEPDFPPVVLPPGTGDNWVDNPPVTIPIEANPLDQHGPVWWYHSDHLGSTSYITDVLGTPVQYIEYLPFGEVMVEQSTNNILENVYKFNSKELDESTGYYYYGARYYDPGTSVFLSPDPHAEKYPNINPYTYVGNNPINAIDPDGRDIVVLSYGAKRRGHKYGHLAMLIGDDKKGWTYFSLDGGRYTYQNQKGEESVKHGYSISKKGEYKSVEEFAQSQHNTFKENYYDGKGFENSERDRDGNLLQRYEKAYQITTTEEQNTMMYNTADKITKDDYSNFTNWCTDNVNGAVEAGGLEGADKTTFWPNSYFNDIESKNNGVRIDSKLKINDVNKGNENK